MGFEDGLAAEIFEAGVSAVVGDEMADDGAKVGGGLGLTWAVASEMDSHFLVQ